MCNKKKGRGDKEEREGIVGQRKKGKKKRKKEERKLCDSKMSISGLFVWLEVVMAAMLCELFGLALASGL